MLCCSSFGFLKFTIIICRSFEFFGTGCMADDRVVVSPNREVELVDYKGEKATILFGRHHGRVDLMPNKNFALFFHPVSTGDTGLYMCSLNGRPPESLVQLLVQGNSPALVQQ